MVGRTAALSVRMKALVCGGVRVGSFDRPDPYRQRLVSMRCSASIERVTRPSRGVSSTSIRNIALATETEPSSMAYAGEDGREPYPKTASDRGRVLSSRSVIATDTLGVRFLEDLAVCHSDVLSEDTDASPKLMPSERYRCRSRGTRSLQSLIQSRTVPLCRVGWAIRAALYNKQLYEGGPGQTCDGDPFGGPVALRCNGSRSNPVDSPNFSVHLMVVRSPCAGWLVRVDHC
jgi:hypothetical protein